MKKILLIVILLAALAGGLIWGYREMSREQEREGDMEAPVVSESHAARTEQGTVVITLEAEAQERIGLRAEAVSSASLSREAKAFGRVLDPTPLVTQLGAVVSAQTALEYAHKDYQRLKTLHEQEQNVSARALEIAEAALKQAQIQFETARLNLAAAWGGEVAGQEDLPGFIRSLATRTRLLARVDLPRGAWAESAPRPTSARMQADELSDPRPARVLGSAPQADPQIQGAGFLLVLDDPPSTWAPGLALTAWISLGGEAAAGVRVPRAAVLAHEGRRWVFVQTSPATFERREVTLDHPVEDGWWVGDSLRPGDKLVLTGAQALLSEEGKLAIQMED